VAASVSASSLLWQARLAQVLTLTWMTIEFAIAIGAGLAARSVALTAFGVDSGIELFTAGVVLRRLLQRSAAEERGERTAGEKRASRLVGYGLYALITYIVVSAGASLVLQIRPEGSPAGLVVTGLALFVMTGLWRWRLGLADRLGSPALRGDAACSLVCLYLAGTTLAGLLLNQLFGLWWADPIAGLALVWWIRGEANEALEAGRSGADPVQVRLGGGGGS
jgi:divalent metal cation (Fe/Co/Zn/Cd) transporter